MSSKVDLTQELVEKFLDSNEKFTKSYFDRKATSAMVDHWMLVRSRRPGSRSMDVSIQSVSPKRERGKSMVGSVTSAKIKSLFVRTDSSKQMHSKVHSELAKLDEKELFMELIRDIANELDINRLSHKILVNVSILTNADRCSLFLTRGKKDNKVLVSKLFDVTTDSTVEESIRSEDDQITVPFGIGIAGNAAQTGESINIKDAYADPRFNRDVDKATGYKTHSILSMPVKSHDGEVIGVAQIINKKTGSHHFSEKDEEVFRNYLTFCGIGIANAQLFEISVQEYKRNQVLLQLAKGIFEEQTSLDQCVHNIMVEAQELLQCERCTVFLIDNSPANKGVVFSKCFDLHFNSEDTSGPRTFNTHLSMNSGIAALVASTGETLNIPNAYADSRFNPEADKESGFTTKSILSMPIFNREQNIIGVAQLLNKLDDKPFYDSDENLFEAFAIFCGLGIHNTNLYEEACKLLAKQSVAMEVLSYHATAQPGETEKIVAMKIPTAEELQIYTFEFNDMKWSDDETILAAFRIFMELETVELFHILPETMCRWLLSVRKNYRPVIYHNWRHAFNVAQTMFTILTTGSLNKYFSALEVFGLIVACLCHDLDHRGTNNAFQAKTESALGILYGTSTMEHHHFDHCIMILNGEGNNIFSELSPEDYRFVIKILEHAILSTDLALYFKKRSLFEKEISDPNTDWHSDSNRELLRAMMMTVCDVAAIAKPWEIQRSVAELVASEFFEQGDLEREQLNAEPIPMMDRAKKSQLPSMQVGFIDFICLPIYKLFCDLEPAMKPMYDGCINNRENWQALADQAKEQNSTEGDDSKKENNSKKKEEPTKIDTKARKGRKLSENNNKNPKAIETGRKRSSDPKEARKTGSATKQSEKKTSIERIKPEGVSKRDSKEKGGSKDRGKGKGKKSKLCSIV